MVGTGWKKGFIALAVAISVGAPAMPANANGWFKDRLHKRQEMPPCNDPVVAGEVIEDFNWAEKNTWKRGFEMLRLARMHEHRTIRWRDSQVRRLYCMATAVLSNGRKRHVYYLIEDRSGFAGKSWGVTACVSGLDPWRNHGAHCRTVR